MRSAPVVPLLVLVAAPLAAQTELHREYGRYAGELFGAEVAVLSDLDGDGISEWMAGRGGMEGQRPELFVFSGHSGALLFDLGGEGAINEFFLQSMVDVGDVDLDGVRDFAFGNSTARSGGLANVGRVSVYSGRTGEKLYFTPGPVSFGAFGASLASIGDVDLDGRPDLVVGQIGTQDENAWVMSGADGALLRGVSGPHGNDPEFGWSVAATGDVDGDARPDFAVGTLRVGVVRCFSSASGAVLRQWTGGRTFGRRLVDLGDVDGDGARELLISETGLRRVVLVSGRTGETLARFETGDGVESLASAGDLDGDGANDFLVGDGAAQNGSGVARIFSTRTGRVLVKLVGTRPAEHLGSSVAGGADFDADGRPDFVLGAPGADAFVRGGSAGRVSTWSAGARGVLRTWR